LIKTRVISSEEDPRLPKGTEGILLTDVTGADPRLKLKAGDLVVALDDQPLKDGEAAERFSKWVQGDNKATKSSEENNPMEIMGPVKPGQRNQPWWQSDPIGKKPKLPSAQILRGGKRLDLEVILGRSPSYLPDRRMMLQRIDASRVETAQAEFDAWWRDWFTSETATLDPFDASRAWDLNP